MSRHDARQKYGAEIEALVDAAPPLTPAQRSQLAAILNAGRSVTRRPRSARRKQNTEQQTPKAI